MSDLATFFRQVADRPDAAGTQDDAKRASAKAALALVKPGMRLGLGTGSTVDFFLQGLASRIKDGLEIEGGIPTSRATEVRAMQLGIPLLGSPRYDQLNTDLCVDGADRVDLTGSLIKGGGGALLREKLVASHSKSVCILVDSGKLRAVFDESFAVPVECVTFGISSTISMLRELGCQAVLRTMSRTDEPFVTDNGNFIVDCKFVQIPDPEALALRLSTLVGVVEGGIFCGLLDHLLVGFGDSNALSWSRS